GGAGQGPRVRDFCGRRALRGGRAPGACHGGVHSERDPSQGSEGADEEARGAPPRLLIPRGERGGGMTSAFIGTTAGDLSMRRLRAGGRESLVDTVVERIRAVIEQGHLKAGDRLPTEAELSAQLGVSRTVVREAVSQLESVGLLSVQRGRGTFVGDGS